MSLSAYEDRIADMVPRFLTQVDRSPFSNTYGCMDRNWWHYKSATAFPSAPYQQGVLVLGWLLKNGGAGIAPGSQEILSLLCAALRFWSRIQHHDGSFDEWYPNEHSFVATAFTTYAVSEVLLNTKKGMDEETLTLTRAALEKAGRWLETHEDLVVCNHEAGKIAALGNLACLFPEGAYADAARRAVKKLIARQHREGWFPEYGGADPSYQSLTCDFLAKYYARSQDSSVCGPLEKGIEFLNWFLHPDGTWGGTHGCRNAQYLMTQGLELVAETSPAARTLLTRAHAAGGGDLRWIPIGIDDRYLVFFFLPNILGAYDVRKDRKNALSEERFQTSASCWFEQAGIFVSFGPEFYFVCNIKKGGVLRAYSKCAGDSARLVVQDGGYYVRLSTGEIAASQFYRAGLETDPVLRKDGQDTEFQVSVHFGFVKRWLSDPVGQILFLLWSLTFGRIAFFRGMIDIFLKGQLIQGFRPAPLRCDRIIKVGPKGLKITDVVSRKRGIRISKLGKVGDATVIHVPSSRLYTSWDGMGDFSSENTTWRDELNKMGQVQIEKTVSF